MAFFLKAIVMIKVLQKVTVYLVKNSNFFRQIFGENILKIKTTAFFPNESKPFCSCHFT
jgi:hypothetical protein